MDASTNADQMKTTAWDVLNECLPGLDMCVFKGVAANPDTDIAVIVKLDAYDIGASTSTRMYFPWTGKRPHQLPGMSSTAAMAALMQSYNTTRA